MIKIILRLVAAVAIFIAGATAGPFIFKFFCATKGGLFCLL